MNGETFVESAKSAWSDHRNRFKSNQLSPAGLAKAGSFLRPFLCGYGLELVSAL
jgi:hypothetical protein